MVTGLGFEEHLLGANFDQVKGTAPLFLTYIRRFREVEQFYSWDPSKEWSHHIENLQARQYPRAELADILFRQMQAFGFTRAAEQRAALLARRDTMVVITGQQVGLFGGPLYTLYKALTAIRLSRYLEERYKKPFLPIFWMVSEDHDLAEVDQAWIIDKNGELVGLRWQGGEGLQGLPACGIKLKEEIKGLIARLDESLHPTEFKGEILAHLQEAYGSGESFATAFARWIYWLLGDYGLIVVDPSDPALKRLAGPVFVKEIKEPAAPLAATAGRRLRENGYSPQMEVDEYSPGLFFLAPERVRVVRDQEQFRLGRRGLLPQQLEKVAQEQPELLSPNVLLTPILQSFLFPAVACVTGPAEVCYLAQLKEVFAHFALPMPVVFPRQSLTLLERRTARFLKEEGISLGQLLKEDKSWALQAMPKALADLLQNIKGEREEKFGRLKELVENWDKSLAPNVLAARNAAAYHLSILEKKLIASQKKKEGTFLNRLTVARNRAFPKRQLQERVLNFIPYLVRYGRGFTNGLLAELDLFSWEHRVHVL